MPGMHQVAVRPPASGTDRTQQDKPAILRVDDLCVAFPSPAGEVKAVDNVSFTCGPQDVIAIVGESGSGKSATILSILRLIDGAARLSGRVEFDGVDLLAASAKTLLSVRGARIAMIFQNPRASLNPGLTIGTQMVEVLRRHGMARSRREGRARAEQLLQAVHLSDPARILAGYAHQLSGGMCQRVAIAMALSCEPDLLIADEPTTALDALVQASILAQLAEIRRQRGLPMIVVTHDFGVVRALATHVLVMYAGACVETGLVDTVLGNPLHPYTKALIAAVPPETGEVERLAQIEGQPPDLLQPPAGCAFAPRCPAAVDLCGTPPPSRQPTAGRMARCHLVATS